MRPLGVSKQNLHIKLHDSFWFHRLYFFNVILQQIFYLYRTSRIQIQRIGRKIKSIELYEWLGLNINQYSCCYLINYFENTPRIIWPINYMSLTVSYYMIQRLPDNYRALIFSYDINHKMFINNSWFQGIKGLPFNIWHQ